MAENEARVQEIERILGRVPDAAASRPQREDGLVADVEFLYREGNLLVREEHVDDVVAVLSDNGAQLDAGERRLLASVEGRRLRPGETPVVPGLSRLTWTQRTAEFASTRLLDVLDEQLGVGVARPDHLIVVSSHPCPATEPEQPGIHAPFPRLDCGCRHGAGVMVSIVDTGITADAAQLPWMANARGDNDDLVQGAAIELYGGHGTFVAGTLLALAPEARVQVEGSHTIVQGHPSLTAAGAAYESDLAAQMVEALSHDPDIMILTFATETRKDLSLLGFDLAFEHRLRHAKGLAFLAPAGNNGSSRRQWPAAFDWVISVGALSANWRTRATFSNHGPWVDVYAPGEDLVNAYASGTYTYQVPADGSRQAEFSGVATWSGTSFSTPLVAGMVAARMSVTGQSGRRAAESLLREADEHFIPGVGPALLPDRTCRFSGCRCGCGGGCGGGGCGCG